MLISLSAAAALAGCHRLPDPVGQDAPDAPLQAARAFPPEPPASGLPPLADNKYGELVRQGYAIFVDTPVAASRYSGNALACSNCHLDGGRRANAAPMWAAWGMYPAFLAKTDRVTTFEERIQQSFRFSLNGLPPPLDSQEMHALQAYAQWLASGQQVGVEKPGRGFPTIARTGADPDAFRGRGVYASRCASCHGAHGEGAQTAAGKWTFPPLWGHASFNKGAGMSRVDLLAGFIKANMPYGNADLGDQEALDVAAWIALQERWPDPRKGLVAGWLEP
jgi:thiosulfate dehydrogenase